MVLYYVFQKVRRNQLAESLSLTLLLVRIVKEGDAKEKSSAEKQDFKSEITKTEQLISNLAASGRAFALELAVPHVGEEIHFYIAIPQEFVDVATRQIQSLWPNSAVEDVPEDYNIFNPSGAVSAGYVKLKENYALPLRTYQEIGTDSFASIIGSFAKVAEIGEGASLQIMVRPASGKLKKGIQHVIGQLKHGSTLESALGGGRIKLSDITEAINPPTPEELEKKEKNKFVDEDSVKALESKIAKPLFWANIRILASAPTPFQADDLLQSMAAGFSQFESPKRNGFRIIKAKNPKKLSLEYSFRTFDTGSALVLNSEEIASFYHLPISTTETPRIKWLKSKEAPPPADMPSAGTLVGHSIYRGAKKDVFMTDADRRRHFYIIGQTGTGKTTALANMALEDIKNGKGFAVIDPHGDFADGVLKHIPKSRIEDVIYFNPADFERPLGLNMLEYRFDRPEEKTFIVNEMLNIFDKLYDLKTTGGPMFEQYMRNSLLLLMEDMPNEEATLMEVPRIFQDADYRKRKLARIHNPVVVDFWEKEAQKAGGDAALQNVTPYITSKFNTFIANDYMRPIIGQAKSSFNFRQIMDEGKILLINLSKGRIGDINANLLGMIFTGKMLFAALSRVDIDASQRRDFNLYIDEFQNFTSDSISVIFSEARKYGLTLNVAHQFIAQLPEKIRDSVFGNVGTIASCRVSPQDAEFLVKQFAPAFSENDLMNIDNLNACIKLLINGQTGKAFNMQIPTTFFSPGNPDLAVKLKEYSLLKYGRERVSVEEDIKRRLRD